MGRSILSGFVLEIHAVEQILSDTVIARTGFSWYTMYITDQEVYMIIGKKIKEFRLRNNMTQEQLAAELNVSYQAVSKWERSTTTPDISLIPLIAEKLGVSCDALLTDDGVFSKEEIERIIRHAQPEDGESETDDQYAKRLQELEEAYEKYPRSFHLMHALAQKYSQGGAHQNAPDEYLEKAIRLETAIAEYCPDTKLKYDVTTMLCYFLEPLGRYDEIRRLADSMPEFYQTRPALIFHSMTGEAHEEGIHDCLEGLLNMAENYFNLLLYGTVTEKETELFQRLHAAAADRNRWCRKKPVY